MRLKRMQIIVVLNLDCLWRISLYSDCIPVVWIAFLALCQLFSHLRCPKLVMSSYATSMVNSMPTIMLYCIVLYCIVLYCIVLYYFMKEVTPSAKAGINDDYRLLPRL